jgi:hypothetical protein
MNWLRRIIARLMAGMHYDSDPFIIVHPDRPKERRSDGV